MEANHIHSTTTTTTTTPNNTTTTTTTTTATTTSTFPRHHHKSPSSSSSPPAYFNHNHNNNNNSNNHEDHNHHQHHDHQEHQHQQQHLQQQQQQQHQSYKPPATTMKMAPLPALARFYFYGLHGLMDEIVFTALFDLLFEPAGNPQLKGYTTITTFFIYGALGSIMEYFFLYCVSNGLDLKYRMMVYVPALYVWEFAWGLCLRQFNACSWDYSHYPLNLLGLITLTYAPVWSLLCVFQDYIYRYIFRIHVLHGKPLEKLP